jgi:hypothetical protein
VRHHAEGPLQVRGSTVHEAGANHWMPLELGG